MVPAGLLLLLSLVSPSLCSQVELGRPWCLAPLGGAFLPLVQPAHLSSINSLSPGNKRLTETTLCPIVITFMVVISL